MAKLPEAAIEAWDNRKGAVVLTTISEDGVANSIYATCVSKFNDETLVVADNYFDKTRKNISEGCRGVLLYISENDKAYQVKGSLTYHIDGKIFDDMKQWNPEKHPGVAAVAIKVEELYKGAEKLI